MNAVLVDKKTAVTWERDKLLTYHVEMFHGTVVNERIHDNHLGDGVSVPLRLEKNVYKSNYIIKPCRNLILPEGAKQRLDSISNIEFLQVLFTKLFFAPFEKGDHSFGPEDYRQLDSWLASFRNDGALRQEMHIFFELVVPKHTEVLPEFKEVVTFDFKPDYWLPCTLALSREMLLKYPVMWSKDGVILREDVFKLIEEFICWDYFYKGVFTLPG